MYRHWICPGARRKLARLQGRRHGTMRPVQCQRGEEHFDRRQCRIWAGLRLLQGGLHPGQDVVQPIAGGRGAGEGIAVHLECRAFLQRLVLQGDRHGGWVCQRQSGLHLRKVRGRHNHRDQRRPGCPPEDHPLRMLRRPHCPDRHGVPPRLLPLRQRRVLRPVPGRLQDLPIDPQGHLWGHGRLDRDWGLRSRPSLGNRWQTEDLEGPFLGAAPRLLRFGHLHHVPLPGQFLREERAGGDLLRQPHVHKGQPPRVSEERVLHRRGVPLQRRGQSAVLGRAD
mmetsp:Transcript_87153/g.144956  ORF Transcript_87153/g.144956 Transcript_87153/m.144956 type:complete len:281 (-) Transcript_87153:99-941(-)